MTVQDFITALQNVQKLHKGSDLSDDSSPTSGVHFHYDREKDAIMLIAMTNTCLYWHKFFSLPPTDERVTANPHAVASAEWIESLALAGDKTLLPCKIYDRDLPILIANLKALDKKAVVFIKDVVKSDSSLAGMVHLLVHKGYAADCGQIIGMPVCINLSEHFSDGYLMPYECLGLHYGDFDTRYRAGTHIGFSSVVPPKEFSTLMSIMAACSCRKVRITQYNIYGVKSEDVFAKDSLQRPYEEQSHFRILSAGDTYNAADRDSDTDFGIVGMVIRDGENSFAWTD